MATKGKREKIKLASTALKANGKVTGYFRTTDKNKKTTTGKLQFMMFDPIARVHALFEEKKLK